MVNLPVVMGIDLGTQSIKVVLVDRDGDIKGIAKRAYPTHYSRYGWMEQNPRDWWEAMAACVRDVLMGTGIASNEVAAIGLSGHMHSLVAVGNDGEVIRPVIVWADERAGAEAQQITERLGAAALEITYNPIIAAYTAPKLLWLHNHEPETLENLSLICFPKDYLRWCLTGEWATDPSDASGSMLYDLSSGSWSTRLCDVVNINRDKLPPILPSTEVAGSLRQAAAEELGLKSGIPVVVGAGDLAAALVGAGIVREGLAVINIGTAGQVMQLIDGDLIQYLGKVYLFSHALPKRIFGLGAVPSAGLSLSWLRGSIISSGDDVSAISYDDMDQLAGGVSPGCNGLLFLPHLLGTGTPHLDGNARGCFVGLTPSHDRAALIRATMEGVAFALKENLHLFNIGASVNRREVRLTGGSARSAVWRQIIADVTGYPVRTLQCADASALGAALLAAVGVGWLRDTIEASERVVVMDDVSIPDQEHHMAYEKHFEKYQAVYQAMTGVWNA